mmetsp:Transcript_2814/g.6696  ORF Transcript_2814/g.6696 Transcript_2814/m.6696 type:complete len:351 (-) Transcript_2814:215-1267(-)
MLRPSPGQPPQYTPDNWFEDDDAEELEQGEEFEEEWPYEDEGELEEWDDLLEGEAVQNARGDLHAQRRVPKWGEAIQETADDEQVFDYDDEFLEEDEVDDQELAAGDDGWGDEEALAADPVMLSEEAAEARAALLERLSAPMRPPEDFQPSPTFMKAEARQNRNHNIKFSPPSRPISEASSRSAASTVSTSRTLGKGSSIARTARSTASSTSSAKGTSTATAEAADPTVAALKARAEVSQKLLQWQTGAKPATARAGASKVSEQQREVEIRRQQALAYHSWKSAGQGAPRPVSQFPPSLLKKVAGPGPSFLDNPNLDEHVAVISQHSQQYHEWKSWSRSTVSPMVAGLSL